MKSTKKNFSGGNLITAVTVLFFTLFPIIVDNYYFNITITKHYVFVVFSISMLLFALYYMIQTRMKTHNYSISTLFDHFTATDWLFLAFLVSGTVSCICSRWQEASFTGEQGKYVGLAFMLFCGGIYYSIVNYFVLPSWFEKIFPAMLLLICSMALLQSLGYDILGFYKDMAADYKPMYLATFGHINLFSMFLAVYLPISLYLFCYATNKKLCIFYGISIVFGFMSCFCSNSDAGYIGLIISMALLLIITSGHRSAFRQYSYLCVLLTISSILWKLLATIFYNQMYELSSLTRILTSWYVTVFLAVYSGIIWGISFCNKTSEHLYSERIKYPAATILIIIISILFVALFWFTTVDTTRDLGVFENYLRLNKAWGSNRGYVWSWLIEFFISVPLFLKVFGTGPDTTALILSTYFSEEMATSGDGSYYTTAHNEYLNYLVTIGIAGVTLYIIILILSIKKCIQKASKTPFYGAVGLAIVCYGVTAVITISQTITMPFIFLLIALANTRR